MPATQSSLFLYVAEDCCLCDEAVAVLAEAHAPDFESVSIEGDTALSAKYAIQVPVLHDAGADRDLCWPFDAEGVRRFIGL